MRLALECLTDLLEHVQPFADYDFILAHKVLEDEEYTKFYKESTRFKVVDNSTNEKGEPVSLEDLGKALEAVGGNSLVAPDWIGDSQKTLEALKECLSKYGQQRTIAVVQGKTLEEAIDCFNSINSLMDPRLPVAVSVPYDIGSDKKEPPWLMGLRRALLVSSLPSTVLIHLLGFNGIDELFWYRGRPNITSIDTGVPVMLGLQGKDILDPLEDKIKPTFEKMDGKLSEAGWTAICRNIALLRKYLV